MIAAILLLVVVAYLAWKWGPRRAKEPGFKLVYVNQDGSARELSPEEKTYVSTEFPGGDSSRPYIKWSYESHDGWGSRSGYIERRRVPARVTILPVHPEYDAAVKKIDEEKLDSPNPDLPRKKRFEITRNRHLDQERRREALAKVLA
jgi:hypothetical protein